MEITSKKPVGRFREVIQVPKRVSQVVLTLQKLLNFIFFSVMGTNAFIGSASTYST